MARLVPYAAPAGLFENFRREMDSLMDRFNTGDSGAADAYFAPRTNLAETDKEFEVTVDLPGITAEEVNIEFRDGSLWISGERKSEHEEKGKTWHRVERTYGQFRRGIALGPDVNADKIEAEYKNGVLTVTVPKAEAVHPKKITVKS